MEKTLGKTRHQREQQEYENTDGLRPMTTLEMESIFGALDEDQGLLVESVFHGIMVRPDLPRLNTNVPFPLYSPQPHSLPRGVPHVTYSCVLCPDRKLFISRRQLKQHIANRHRLRSEFRCPLHHRCHWRGTRKDKLVHHIKGHGLRLTREEIAQLEVLCPFQLRVKYVQRVRLSNHGTNGSSVLRVTVG